MLVMVDHYAYLRRKVVRGATKRPGCCRAYLGKPEIGHLNMPIRVQQNIFGFKVPVDDVKRM